MSKSVFVYHILPSMLVMYFAYKPKFVRIIKVAMPVLLFSLFLYPIMEIARNEDVRDSSFVEIFQDASKESARDESVNPLAKPMNRTFMEMTGVRVFRSLYVRKFVRYLLDMEANL